MSSSDPKPRITRGHDGGIIVHVPGETEPFRVLSQRPPHLVLERNGEVRTFAIAVTTEQVFVGDGGYTHCFQKRTRSAEAGGGGRPGHDDLSSPMPGTVLDVLVSEGDEVSQGDRLLVVEAMKMENPVRAPHDSVVSRVHVATGDSVSPGQTLIELEEVQ